MKKQFLFLFLFFITIPLMSYGQAVSKTIAEVDILFRQKSFKQALLLLDKAKKEIEGIYLEELKTDLLPVKIEGYKVADNNSRMVQSFVKGNNIQISRIFTNLDNNSQAEDSVTRGFETAGAEISITISTLPDKMFEFINAYYSGTDAMDMGVEGFMPIVFKDYRAVIQFDEGCGQGRFVAIVGGTIIEVVGQSLAKKDELLDVAYIIDLEKIIKTFGK